MYELIGYFLSSLNLATIQSLLFIYCFWTLNYNTPLGQIYMLFVCLIKNSPQKPSGKKDRRKEYITSFTFFAPVASLKTLHEKTQWEKLIKGKRVQQLMLRWFFGTDP